ncbi:diguanylate cyclase [Paraglaciecola aestuariivivens]
MKLTIERVILRQKTLTCGLLCCWLYCFAFYLPAQEAQQDSQDIVPIFPDVSYCIDPDWLPYEAIRNNQHVGMSADYMRYIGIMAEVNFVLVKTTTWEETLAKLKSGECDVASMLNSSPKRKEYLTFTQAYFTGTNVLVSKDDFGFIQGYEQIGDRTLGAVAGYRHAEYIANYYPEISLQLVDNETAGLQLLADGKIDLFIGSLLSINAKIQKNGFRELYISGIAEPQDRLAMGVSKQNQALVDRLDAAIEQIPEWLHVEVYKEWNNTKVVTEVDYSYLWIAAGIFSLISSIGLWRQWLIKQFNQTLLNKNQQLEELQKQLLEKNKTLEFLSMRDPLTSMFNRNFMIQRCEQERQHCLRHNHSACLIMLDIDHFKPINDTHGHSVGDAVLKELAQMVMQTVREMDVAARWGGEEFLILCPTSEKKDAMLLAERLNKVVAVQSFESVGQVTCSLGVAEFIPKESFIQWFDRADQALYQAKNNGRNKVVWAD